MIDVALWFMDDPFPTSCVALGGTFTWKDGPADQRHRRVPANEFPKGWIPSRSRRVSARAPSRTTRSSTASPRTLDSRDWVSRPAPNRPEPGAEEVKLPEPAGEERSHVGNWLDCMRSRQTPNAPMQAGYAHAVACCLGREAERTGRRVRVRCRDTPDSGDVAAAATGRRASTGSRGSTDPGRELLPEHSRRPRRSPAEAM